MIDWLKQFRNYIFAFVMFNSSSYTYGWAKEADGIFLVDCHNFTPNNRNLFSVKRIWSCKKQRL